MSMWILLVLVSLQCTNQSNVKNEVPVEDLTERVSSAEGMVQVIETQTDRSEVATTEELDPQQDVASKSTEITEQQIPSQVDTKKVARELEFKDVTQSEQLGGTSPSNMDQSMSQEWSVKNQVVEESVILVDLEVHNSFDKLLKQYVNAAGKVNYQGFLADRQLLDAYLEALSSNPPQANWSRSKKLAFWINAYNAFTIRLILDHFPVNSIQDIWGGKPWDKQWINIGGETYSLNQIENDIIRPDFGEPRIHFAVNCAAKSCPPLANRAYTEENLNELLDRQTRAFINDPTFNNISPNSLQISKIFDWYGVDFKNLVEFISKYSEVEINSNATVSYKEYNWSLNN